MFRYIFIRSKPAHRAPWVDFGGGQVSSWGSDVVVYRDLASSDGDLDSMGIGLLWLEVRYHADVGGSLVGGYVVSLDGE